MMSDAQKPGPSFEENLAELETIVRDLEDGKTSLETGIARYEQGIQLLKSCHALLRDAEQKILELTGVDENGEPTTRPFDAAGTKVQAATKGDKADVPF